MSHELKRTGRKVGSPGMNRYGVLMLGLCGLLAACGGHKSSGGVTDVTPETVPPVDAMGVASDITPPLDTFDAIDADAPEVPDVVPIPEGCCADDEDCDPTMVCVRTKQADLGQCAPLLGEPYCYLPSHCPVLHDCTDSLPCDCGEDCQPIPGTCRPISGPCCVSDEDCPEGAFCLIPESDPYNTVCLALPVPGKCWNDSFCGEGEVCEGAKRSGCSGTFFFTEPGDFGDCVPIE